jgi:5S rRNA maturation endonuclease (ribonuclease M5)
MNIDEFLPRLQGVKKTACGWSARCPAHEDKRQSLSVAGGEKGIILKCFAGCEVKDIAAKLGVKVKDLFFANGKARQKSLAARGKPWIVAEYNYTDEKGVLLFQVVRFEPKDFRQRKPDSHAPGGWNWSTKGVRRVLFHLPQLLASLKADNETPVFIVEGEKDVLALEKQHCLATCNPGGAGKWLAEYGACLASAKKIIVVSDKDEPGRKHAREVAGRLARSGCKVVCIEVPGEKNKDTADFLAAGGEAGLLLELALKATELQPTQPATVTRPTKVTIESVAKANLPECVFQFRPPLYWVPCGREWIPLNDSHIAVHFKGRGFGDETWNKDTLGVTVLEHALQRVRMERGIKYAGPLAGYWPGMVDIDGRKILVTEGPNLIQPKRGDWPILRGLMEAMLKNISVEHGNLSLKQWDLFCGWVKFSYEALRDKSFRHGPALTLCGPPRSGKTQLAGILADCLGGRWGDPYSWIVGESRFNSELLGCEVLIADDEASETDFVSRQKLGQRVKQICVGKGVRIEGKGTVAGSWRPFWRLIMLLNEEPHDLKVLPPMEEGVKDKFLLLRVASYTWPKDSQTFMALKAAIMAELPAFIHFLLNEFQLPKELSSERYGVCDWRHPDLLFDLENLQPWRRLLELIDHVRPWSDENNQGEVWEGTVADLTELLKSKAPGRTAQVIRDHDLAGTGMHLRSAQSRLPERIGQRSSSGHTVWIIKRPQVSA